MQLSEIKSKLKNHYKKIIAVMCVIVLVIFSNCIIDGKVVCRFTTEFNSINVTEEDFDNIRGLYFLKKLMIDCYDTNNVSFLENKNFLEYFSIMSKADDWSSLKNCPKLQLFYADGQCTFHNLKDFSGMENLKNLCIGSFNSNSPKIESLDGLQDISKTLTLLILNGIENETILNLEKFSNLRYLEVKNSSLREIHVNSYLESLNVSNNPNLRAIYLPSDYGTPEKIITDNSPYVNIIYE
ncbi:MAG: hypothetical protein NC205_04255 [Prevotella sp.]|nr:hypothetical protein [Alistipes senegalensis]MCM1357784.1 hypothetical protein [Prevotella sp.]MCM1473532.1 hypothetical protein [Muribaculaceae bacterium]